MADNQDDKGFASIDDLFATSIDDLADLPSFETPPPGSYILKITMDAKEVADKPAVEALLEVVETVELKDPVNTVAVPVGTKFSTVFFIDNKFGLGNLKKILKPFAEHFGKTNLGELIRDDMTELTIACNVKNRKDKKDPDRVYGSVTDIIVQ